jgi:hypothetical protein
MMFGRGAKSHFALFLRLAREEKIKEGSQRWWRRTFVIDRPKRIVVRD